ncbi:phosphodiester glycosidase family protein [Kitasatospora sp. Root107]|uniref:phosphodiester glycosidase family protein n=1 Tax=Kitasatospora sp. Root107 TaxID=1736424 RepID=UPI00351131CF
MAATGAAVGPELAAGRPLKAAVPSAQRFGWALPGGAAVEDVVGVGLDGRARFGRLALAGTVRSPAGAVPLEGLNQYALPVGGVGAFTADWGAASRARAVCGSDVSRAAPCSGETREVTVRRGRVTATVPEPGEGRVAADSVVLVGREAGARYLSGLRVGDPVQLAPHLLDAGGGGLLRWALGSSVILAGGRPVDGLNASVAEPRSCVGIGASGRRLYLLATDGRGGESAGLTVRGLAVLMGELGAESAGQLDGGGSATLVARDVAASGRPAVRNRLDGGAERAVPNGIGVFSPGAGRPGG